MGAQNYPLSPVTIVTITKAFSVVALKESANSGTPITYDVTMVAL